MRICIDENGKAIIIVTDEPVKTFDSLSSLLKDFKGYNPIEVIASFADDYDFQVTVPVTKPVSLPREVMHKPPAPEPVGVTKTTLVDAVMAHFEPWKPFSSDDIKGWLAQVGWSPNSYSTAYQQLLERGLIIRKDATHFQFSGSDRKPENIRDAVYQILAMYPDLRLDILVSAVKKKGFHAARSTVSNHRSAWRNSMGVLTSEGHKVPLHWEARKRPAR